MSWQPLRIHSEQRCDDVHPDESHDDWWQRTRPAPGQETLFGAEVSHRVSHATAESAVQSGPERSTGEGE